MRGRPLHTYRHAETRRRMRLNRWLMMSYPDEQAVYQQLTTRVPCMWSVQLGWHAADARDAALMNRLARIPLRGTAKLVAAQFMGAS